jgi:fused signal recognition particle receptor
MTLWNRLRHLALRDVSVLISGGVDARALEALEELLLGADFGVAVTERLVAAVRARAERGEVRSAAELSRALRDEVERALRAGRSDPSVHLAATPPTVIVVLGVNGSGKTTFIGKLAARFRHEGRRVVVAAADTFRAAAVDQLRVWAERAGAEVVGGASGGDPAAVAWAAIDAAVARGADVVIVDTAGRLHTSDALLEELRKVARVVARRMPGAPHESLLVLDATIGQNAVAQALTFAQAVPITGLVVNKLDGTARGGVVLAVHEALDVPVKFAGVGEALGDLEPFDAAAFAAELTSG